MTDRSLPPPPAETGAIQRDRDPRLDSNLHRFERSRNARYLNRLAADQDLILHLQLSNFDEATEDWKQFARALTEYGYAVFRAWFGTGEIVKRLAAKNVRGRRSLPEPFVLHSEDAAHELAAELVIRGVKTFRANVLLAGRWNLAGGASLKTYFIGHLLFQVPDTFQRWARDSGLDDLLTDDDATFEPQLRPGHTQPRGAADRVEDAIVAEQIGRHLTPLERQLFELEVADLSTAEAAEVLGEGISVSKVKSDKMRARQRINRIYPERDQWIS